MLTETRTPIAIVRDHVEAWRHTNRWSRETLADQIVAAHVRGGFDRITGIAFDPPTRDTYERMRVNADKIYRWLDDASKDKNLLSVNMLWTILAALPDERRLALALALLSPVGLVAGEVDGEIGEGAEAGAVHHFRDVVAAASESQLAMSSMLDGIDPGEPEIAQVKLGRAAQAVNRALAFVGRLARRRTTREVRHAR